MTFQEDETVYSSIQKFKDMKTLLDYKFYDCSMGSVGREGIHEM